jgi:hypothetical protein
MQELSSFTQHMGMKRKKTEGHGRRQAIDDVWVVERVETEGWRMAETMQGVRRQAQFIDVQLLDLFFLR